MFFPIRPKTALDNLSLPVMIDSQYGAAAGAINRAADENRIRFAVGNGFFGQYVKEVAGII